MYRRDRSGIVLGLDDGYYDRVPRARRPGVFIVVESPRQESAVFINENIVGRIYRFGIKASAAGKVVKAG